MSENSVKDSSTMGNFGNSSSTNSRCLLQYFWMLLSTKNLRCSQQTIEKQNRQRDNREVRTNVIICQLLSSHCRWVQKFFLEASYVWQRKKETGWLCQIEKWQEEEESDTKVNVGNWIEKDRRSKSNVNQIKSNMKINFFFSFVAIFQGIRHTRNRQEIQFLSFNRTWTLTPLVSQFNSFPSSRFNTVSPTSWIFCLRLWFFLYWSLSPFHCFYIPRFLSRFWVRNPFNFIYFLFSSPTVKSFSKIPHSSVPFLLVVVHPFAFFAQQCPRDNSILRSKDRLRSPNGCQDPLFSANEYILYWFGYCCSLQSLSSMTTSSERVKTSTRSFFPENWVRKSRNKNVLFIVEKKYNYSLIHIRIWRWQPSN